MARYQTTVPSTLTPADAFGYMADFTHAAEWDPSVSSAVREGDGPAGLGSVGLGSVGLGTAFDLVARFAGRDVKLRYEIVGHSPPRSVTLEAKQPSFTSRDTITVSPDGEGSSVHYDAALTFRGVGRIFDPVMQLLFNRLGRNAAAGLRRTLNP